MPIGTPTVLFDNTNFIGTGTTSWAPTATITVSPGAMVIVYAYAREETSGGSPANPDITLSNTHAGTWSWTKFGPISTGLTNEQCLVVWTAIVPPEATTGQISFAYNKATTQRGAGMLQITGVLGTALQSKIIAAASTSATPSVTFTSALTAGSAVLAFIFSSADSDGFTAGSGYTIALQRARVTTAPGGALASEYNLSPSSTTVGFSGANTSANVIIALELAGSAPASSAVSGTVSSSDTDSTASGTLDDTGGLHLVEVYYDDANNKIGIILDGGTPVETAVATAFNAQQNSLIIGTSLVNGAVQTNSAVVDLGYLDIYSTILTNVQLNSARKRAGLWLRPNVRDGSSSGVDIGGGNIPVAAFVQNPTGEDEWQISSVSVLTQDATAVVAADDQSIDVSSITASVGDILQFEITVENLLPTTIRSSSTFRLTAAVTSAVLSNGFSASFRIVIPAGIATETLTNIPVRFSTADFTALKNELRTVANGGLVENSNGWDIRFEDEDGNKLPHELTDYSATTGVAEFWVKVPQVTQTGRTTFFIFYGKAGLSASEANQADTWSDYIAVWNCRTGADRTGHSRNVYPNVSPSDVGAGTLIGDAGSYDGVGSDLSTSLLDWFGGWDAVSVQARIKCDADALASNRGWLTQGVLTAAGTVQGLSFYYRASGGGGQAKPILFNVTCGSATAQQGFAVSAANQQTSDAETVHATWASGFAPKIYREGVAVALDNSQAATGTVQKQTGDLYIGRASGPPSNPSAGPWKGLLDEIRIRASELTAGWCAFEAINHGKPSLTYGVGGKDLPSDGNHAPVAMPVRVTCTVGTGLLIDVLGRAVDPDAGSTLTITSAGTPSSGSVTILTGKVNYVAAQVGVVTWQYTISDGSKTSVGTIEATAQASSTPVQDLPAAKRIIRLPAVEATVKSILQNNGDPAAFVITNAGGSVGPLQAGDRVLIQNGTLQNGNVAVTKDANAANPIVIAGENLPDAGGSGGCKIAAPFQFQINADHVWLSGFNYSNYDGLAGAPIQISGSFVRVRRLLIDNFRLLSQILSDGQLNDLGFISTLAGSTGGIIEYLTIRPRVYDLANGEVGTRCPIHFRQGSTNWTARFLYWNNFTSTGALNDPSHTINFYAANFLGLPNYYVNGATSGNNVTINNYDHRKTRTGFVGNTASSPLTTFGHSWEDSLMENIDISSNRPCLEFKARECHMRRIRWIQTDGNEGTGHMRFRQGWANTIEECNFEAGSGINVFDGSTTQKHQIWGTKTRGMKRGLLLIAGQHPITSTAASTFPPCTNMEISDCDLHRLEVGMDFGFPRNFPVTQLGLYGNIVDGQLIDTSAKFLAAAKILKGVYDAPTVAGLSGRPTGTPTLITASDVGFLAGL